MAAGTSLNIDTLKKAFADIRAALDDIARFRQEALPQMAAGDRRARQALRRGRHADREHGQRAQDRRPRSTPSWANPSNGGTRMKKLLLALLFAFAALPALAQNKFRVAWSHYTGWEPWAYAQQAGILKKWAEEVQHRDRARRWSTTTSNRSTSTPSGKFDACAMTNMDVLTIPAVGGVDTHGAHRRRLLQRQRRHRHEERQEREGPEGPQRQAGRVHGVALHAGAGARDERHDRARHQDRQHERRRHRRGVRVRRRTARRSPGIRRCSRRATPRARRWCSTPRKIPGEIIDLMVVRSQRAGFAQEGAGRRVVRDDERS